MDSIEHGSYMNDEDIAAMKAHGTYFVPTAYLIDWMQQYGNLPPLYAQKMKDVSSVEKANAKRAIKAGVKVALGTDAAVYPHGLNAHEIDVYVNQFGMTPLEGHPDGDAECGGPDGLVGQGGFDCAGEMGGRDCGGGRPAEGCAGAAACGVRDEVRGGVIRMGEIEVNGQLLVDIASWLVAHSRVGSRSRMQ